MNSKSSPKHTIENHFKGISSFDLFHQLTYMAATSASGISRARIFQLARNLANPTARYFKHIHDVAENLRYNYPDAVRLVGEQTLAPETKNFLLSLADALRSGESLSGFLMREAKVQEENYSNDYLHRLENLKKWTDAYASVAVSAALIIIINMVMTMIYSINPGVMMMMVFVAVSADFGVAWVVFRSAPAEVKNIPLAKGSEEERLTRKLALVFVPLSVIVAASLSYVSLPLGWVLIVAGAVLLPPGIISMIFDGKTDHRDAEVSSFLRSLGGTATSRGTTIKDALLNMKIDSFPHLQPNIYLLCLRLKAFADPRFCWAKLGDDSGSLLVNQSVGIFYEAVNLGGDPERAGLLTSEFAQKVSMLRAQRQGIAGTFSGLTITMHVVLTAVMVFLLTILEQFVIRLQDAMSELGDGSGSMAALGLGNMFSFNPGQIEYLSKITLGMVLFLAVVNAFAIVASEGSHLVKIIFYLAVLLIATGLCYLSVPPLVRMIM